MTALPELSLGDDAAETFSVDPPAKTPRPAAPTSPAPGKGLELVSEELPEAELDGSQMSGAERAAVLLGHWFRLATKTTSDLTANPGVIGSDPPESWAEYRAYVDSKAWIPEGYEGKWLRRVPLAYYNSIGCLGFVGDGVGWLFKRMFRFVATLLIVAVITVLWLCFS
jgi:hypothetical protein